MTTSNPVTAARFDATRPVPDRFFPAPTGELDALGEVLGSGRLSGGAEIVAAYEQALAGWFGVRRVIAVNSGSSALHATLVAAGAGPGTEVLLPATAPLPTALPVLTCGATPVIVDVVPDGLALAPDDVAAKITGRTVAAISLPLWGYPVDDRPAKQVLDREGIALIEDACQAHGTRLPGGGYAGTFGTAGCFSTHERKLLATGEGGFVVTDDAELGEKIDFYTHLGHLRGGHGVNYKLAAPLAAIGLRRLAALTSQLQDRASIAGTLRAALPDGGPLSELPIPDGAAPNYYSMVLLAEPGHATRIAAGFAEAGLPPDSIRFGYRPLYEQPLFHPYATTCPNAEALAARTVQLPAHPDLTRDAIGWTAAAITRLGQRP
ncbi:DegT/DnrJ/EryC1/StrS family aminotransferase [Dactylosporangium sp. NPDC051485]|uniref:DegT/DnrJ/EryC1/StrS family aminotransferase n=1 Tax=Dactylosporangium sp. NPDC051485 TaxID=3154846 RepID=UPI003434018D